MQVLSPAPYLSIEERNMLSKKNDFRAALGILYHWILIVASFQLVFWIPNFLTVVVAIFIMGGQLLACSVMLHDAGHFAVFSNKKLNDFVGNWFGGYPVFQGLVNYRAYHLVHHLNTGLEEDPDLLLTRGYPTNRKSMIRKFWRDLSGQTGIKSLSGLILMHLGYLEYNLGGKITKVDQSKRKNIEFLKVFATNLAPCIIFQFVLFLLLTAFLSPWLYLLWLGAYLTSFQFSIRVRAIAEHSMVEDSKDPWRNTRSTKANWFIQLLFAPYHVNYHVEHHMMMSVPSYNLPRMHKLLYDRGFYNKGLLAPSYWSVIKQAAQQ
ncbi:MAG: fatty acid desaturase [Saprospiraceae bacterium]|jgi:fatty acid desaturase